MSERIASLDCLRGAAALSVAIPHFFMYQHTASAVAETVSILGVEIFFVLSGYVLAPQIVSFCLDRPSLPNFGIFLIRRWMRTIPPYFIALFVVSITAHKVFSADFVRYLLYVQNLFGQHNADDYYSIAWSLSVEEWFYLSFPLFCFVIARMVPQRFAAAISAGLLYVALISAARLIWGDSLHWGSTVRRVVSFRMDAIAWGFLLNIAVHRSEFLRGLTTARVLAGVVLVAGLASALTFTIAQRPSLMIEASFPFYAPALGAAGILLALKLEDTFTRSPILSSVGLFLGRISYSTYLFHLLALSAVVPFAGRLPPLLLLIIYLVLTAGVASLMYVAVEAPVLAARPRYAKVQPR